MERKVGLIAQTRTGPVIHAGRFTRKSRLLEGVGDDPYASLR